MSKRILYIMNVDWNWIKQRPQYLAEELTKYFFVDVVLPINYRKHNTVKDRERQIQLNYWFQLPFGRFSLIRKINNLLIYFYLKTIIRLQDYDVIWMTTPIYFHVVKKIILVEQKVIYDCMDDCLEFPLLRGIQEYCHNEKQLIERADHVFFSANYLKNVILKRYHICNNIKSTIINNAVVPMWASGENSKKKIDHDEKFHIAYIGTIAQWFDFELIEKSLEEFSNIQYEFYGPIEKGVSFQHPRVIFHGPVPHNELMNIMQQADALVMPFKLIPLVLSVNPVKLYEYIASMKPTICIAYDETEIFKDFVYLYHDSSEYIKYIDKLIKGTLNFKRTREEVRLFLNNNTWETRGKIIREIIKNL